MPARLDLIGITTSDLPRALAFYRDLGLDIPDDQDAAPHVEVTLPGGLRLAWTRWRRSDPSTPTSRCPPGDTR